MVPSFDLMRRTFAAEDRVTWCPIHPFIGHPVLERPQTSELAEEEGFGPSVDLKYIPFHETVRR